MDFQNVLSVDDTENGYFNGLNAILLSKKEDIDTFKSKCQKESKSILEVFEATIKDYKQMTFPCIFVLYNDYEYYPSGTIIFQSDFKKKKR